MLNRRVSVAALAMIVLGFASVGLAAEGAAGADEPGITSGGINITDVGIGRFGGAIGAGVVIIGGASGIGRIGLSACESAARQPEAGGRIFLNMIITSAMIEGVTFFAVLVCFKAVG